MHQMALPLLMMGKYTSLMTMGYRGQRNIQTQLQTNHFIRFFLQTQMLVMSLAVRILVEVLAVFPPEG